MSMNFSEFKRLLNSDPGSQDPEYQAARRSDPDFILAAAASDTFERRLARASQLPTPAGLSENLKALALSAPLEERPSPLYRFRYALAATVVLAISATLLTQQLSPSQDSVEAYVAHHFDLDGYDLLEKATTPSVDELSTMLANYGLQITPELASQVRYVKYCPTPEGKGIHLVLDSPQGLVTVIFMPDLVVQEGQHFAFNDMAADLINLPGRDISAAIIGHPGQLNPALGLAVQDGIARLSSGA